MRKSIEWITQNKRRFLVIGAMYWGLVGGIGIFSIFFFSEQRIGPGEVIAITFGGALGALVGLAITVLEWKLLASRYRSTHPNFADATETTADSLADDEKAKIEFSAKADPAMAREAVRIWFWRMVRKDRGTLMIGSAIFFFLAAWLAFHYQHQVMGAVFLAVSSLGLLYFPFFHYGFQYEAARWARRTPEVRVVLTDTHLLASTADGKKMTFVLAALNYIVERSDFLLVSHLRYVWLCLPLRDLPAAVLERLRSHPRWEKPQS